ncbi:RHS repeat-associated core domain-containing protein [Pseudomonas sp. NBRC 111124]|uniref:RHS repeat-associated core domain-containing protein n=1 Tax=Pseudomonas sp. NBRC 111124 TaxID=1661039 RepID=UPI0009E7AC8F|nr:RHS repeat-associated core domain-containing protein [Pseudomonas sp. NBRC 111124]
MRETTVITTLANGDESAPVSYNAYGYAVTARTHKKRLLYNGELVLDGIYLLGLGHRAYSPNLMRFYSADEHSPFFLGGINSYAYCSADPINYSDPDGRWKHNNRVAQKAKLTAANIHRQTPTATPSTNSTTLQHARSSRATDNPIPRQGRPAHVSDRFRAQWSGTHPQPYNPENRQRYTERIGRLPNSVDPREYSRGHPAITNSEAGVLHMWNNSNTRTFGYLNKKWSTVARYIVIEDRLAGLNPMDNLRRAFPRMPNRNLSKMVYAVDRYVAELRDPSKSTH